jgi:hypothetical protein
LCTENYKWKQFTDVKNHKAAKQALFGMRWDAMISIFFICVALFGTMICNRTEAVIRVTGSVVQFTIFLLRGDRENHGHHEAFDLVGFSRFS